MPNIGPMELIIVLVLALLVLGPKRLPDAGRSLGSGLRQFKESLTGVGEAAQIPETDTVAVTEDAGQPAPAVAAPSAAHDTDRRH